MFFTVCDYLAAIITIISLQLVVKHYKCWLLYALGSIVYTIVCINAHLVGLSILGVLLFFSGILNYFKGRKEKK